MNVTSKLTIVLLLYLLMPCLSAQPATKSLTSYVKNINRFSLLNPQEKAYLHFDNTGYYLGETIWFKAYVVCASHPGNPFLSKVLHIELLTPQGQVVDSRKLKIINGQCHGEFRLQREYRSGFYEIRAYTRNMLNFGDDCMFSRVFPIYSAPGAAGDYTEKKMDAPRILTNLRTKSSKLDCINLSLYPEGGHALVGLRSRIAFKATGDQGQDLDLTGTVYNPLGEPVTTFSTLHQGMGFFELTPEPGEYKIIAECDGRKRTFPLTGIQPSGYVMHLSPPSGEPLQLRLQKSAALPNDTVALSVSCRGIVYLVEAMLLLSEPYLLHLPTSQLPAGCLQLTLFDKQGRILSERLAFNPGPVDYLTVTSRPDKSVNKPLAQVEMELSITDKDGMPVSTNFSLAVRDAGTELHTGYQDNILTDLLLSSDIKGYIENPRQYFTQPDRVSRFRLDLLMLVQGWRRYNWPVMAGVLPFEVRFYAEEGLDISGRVLEYFKDKPEPGVSITYWMLKDGAAFHGRGKTDESGRFHFLFPDSAKIGSKRSLGLQASVNGKRKHCRILLDRVSPRGRAYSFGDVFVKDTLIILEEEIDSLKKNSVTEMQYLEEVVVQKEKIKPDIVLDVERDINILKDRGESHAFNLGEYLESRVSAISSSPGYQYGSQNTFYCYSCKKPATRNKMRSPEASLLSWYIEDVYKISIYYKNKSAWTWVASGECLQNAPHEPAVFITASLYDDGLHDSYQKGIRQTFYNGYSQAKEFYHMDNSKKLPGEADFRRTLYWNPTVRTDAQGKAKICFYNNSSCKRMSVSAEGITEKGVFIIGDDDTKENNI